MLYRQSKTLAFPHTIIFAGNGCLEKGWKPVTEAAINVFGVDSRYENDFDDALFLLICADEMRQNIENCISLHNNDHLFNPIWPEEFINVREEVGRLYNNKINLKPIPKYIQERLYQNDTYVITSNWDSTFWDDKKIKNICQIHGRGKYPESIVLPTEYLRDTEVTLKRLLEMSNKSEYVSKLIAFLKKRYRLLKGAENEVYQWLCPKYVREIIFWGMHLHDYDLEIIELLQFFAMMLSDLPFSPRYRRLEKITLAIPNDPKKRLEKRLRTIFSQTIASGCKIKKLPRTSFN